MKIARVFPRITKATPDDELCFFGPPPLLTLPEIDEVHVSCVFTYDRPKAEELAYQWEVAGAPVKIGGPAYDDPAEGDFVPGRYLKKGYVITSRGCNNHCWFCSAWRREGKLRELPITPGWNVLDNNLLQCSEQHIRNVFNMLSQQKERRCLPGAWRPSNCSRGTVSCCGRQKRDGCILPMIRRTTMSRWWRPGRCCKRRGSILADM